MNERPAGTIWMFIRLRVYLPVHFSGEVQRKSNITKVLDMLEYTGGVKFTISKSHHYGTLRQKK